MKINKFCFLSLFSLACVFQGCMRNPVTGQREIALIPASTEIQLGGDQYAPMQQAQGGIYNADKSVENYVNAVGQKLAAVSDRADLPYEFVVLNNSVPNAWTLPGGKIAVNRGLLTELNSEAELAAVLSHEIVHAAARHGAKSLERGLALQVGLIGLGTMVEKNKYKNAIVGGASIGAALITFKYSRNAEFEADCYGMKYMSKAGYDVSSAVILQETFLRLSESNKRGWLEGLFATHPPSEDRIEANRRTAQQYPSGGFIGREEYQKAISHLITTKDAYKKLDQSYAALEKGNVDKALQLSKEGLNLEPNEAQFYGIIGKVFTTKKQEKDAFEAFSAAIELDDSYYDFYLQRGLVSVKLGDLTSARKDLKGSLELLQTAGAHYALGEIDLSEGKVDDAVSHFTIASEAKSDIGQEARKRLDEIQQKKEESKDKV